MAQEMIQAAHIEAITDALQRIQALLQIDLAQIDGSATEIRQTMRNQTGQTLTRFYSTGDVIAAIAQMGDCIPRQGQRDTIDADALNQAIEQIGSVEAATQWHRPAKGELTQ